MSTELHWVNGPWAGKLAVEARPRGGDWVEDEIANWKRGGVHAVLSLLTAEEERDLVNNGEDYANGYRTLVIEQSERFRQPSDRTLGE